MTMVKLAMALDGAVHIHIADKRATTRWHDEIPKEVPESRDLGSAGKPRRRRAAPAKEGDG
jgi:hypothetical protein